MCIEFCCGQRDPVSSPSFVDISLWGCSLFLCVDCEYLVTACGVFFVPEAVDSCVGGPVGGEVGAMTGGPVGGDVGTLTGGPVGGEVGCPDGSEVLASEGLVGVLYIIQATGKDGEHGTHLHEMPATVMSIRSSFIVVVMLCISQCDD
jgi:hypothetical protein